VVKEDICIATVDSSKDSAMVFKSTIEPMLTENLKNINNSKVALTLDGMGAVNCTLHPKDKPSTGEYVIVLEEVKLYVTGDIKFYCMLLGMENMASSYCVYCTLTAAWS
jgi:hypothetical protein